MQFDQGKSWAFALILLLAAPSFLLPSRAQDPIEQGTAQQADAATDSAGDAAGDSADQDPFMHPQFWRQNLRVSSEIEPAQREKIIAFVNSQKGWQVGEPAEFEIARNPEFFEDLMFSRIKHPVFDPAPSVWGAHFARKPMELAEIMEYYGEEKNRRNSWASNVPLPVDLGDANDPLVFDRLDAAMRPLARRGALLAMASFLRSTVVSSCISNRPAAPGWCPMPAAGAGANRIDFDRPAYISLEVQDDPDAAFVNVIAIAPDNRLIPLFEAQLDPSDPNSDPNSEPEDRARASFLVDNNAAPFRFAAPGLYYILTITTRERIDPRLWQVAPGQRPPAELCAKPPISLLCDANEGLYDRRFVPPAIELRALFVSKTIPPTGRVIRGFLASRSQARWQAEIFAPRDGPPLGVSGDRGPGRIQRMNFEKSHKCGGSYIARGIILTAAHCFKHRKLADLQVRLGTLDIASGGSNFAIRSVVTHKDYGSRSDNADIAIVRIAVDNRLDSLIRRRRLAAVGLAPAGAVLARSDPLAGAQLLLTGWGFTGATASGTNPLLDDRGRTQRNSRKLMGLWLDPLATSRCKAYRAFSAFAADKIICARARRLGGDACYGDSGGPLTRAVGRGRRQLVGIVAAGIGCAQGRTPGVYTKVASYRGWISRAIRKSAQPGKHRLR